MAFGHVSREKEGEKKPTRSYSSVQEKAVAKETNGNRTVNSGATPFQKGDVVSDDFLIECKTKTKDSESITVQKEWLDKNEKEALFMGKRYSAVAINFGPGQDNYYIIDKYLFQELKEYLEKKEK